jgi:hypothetical protein
MSRDARRNRSREPRWSIARVASLVAWVVVWATVHDLLPRWIGWAAFLVMWFGAVMIINGMRPADLRRAFRERSRR